MAKMASANVEFKGDNIRVIPLKNSEQELLTATFGRNPQRSINKNDLLSTGLSFVWDSIRREVQTKWNAPDVEYPKAKRGFLTLNGTRDIARFNHVGIGCPYLTAKPKVANHQLLLKWDYEIGAVEFKIPKLDAMRYHVLKNLVNKIDGWKIGTLYLNERNGKLFIQLSYSRPDKKVELDESKVLNVDFTDDQEQFIKISDPAGQYTSKTISAIEAIGWLDELSAIRKRYEKRKAACGNPRRPWGSRKQWNGLQKRLTNNSTRRANGIQTRNHLWTRRIVDCAILWNCAIVTINKIPDKLFDRDWKWYQFKVFLEYKINEIGGRCVVVNAQ
jgi:hypothetical protein